MDKIEGKDKEAIEAYRAWLVSQGITPPGKLNVGLLCDNEYFKVVRDAIALPSGRLGTHIRILMSSEVSPGAVCLTRCGDEYVMLRHYRYSTGAVHLECPRGFRQAFETAEETARREVHEETGLVITMIRPLGDMYVNTGLSDELVKLFYGIAEKRQDNRSRQDEGIEKIVYLKSDDFFNAIGSGIINDSFTLSATIRAKVLNLL